MAQPAQQHASGPDYETIMREYAEATKAAAHGDLTRLKETLQRCPEVLTTRNVRSGETMLMCAVRTEQMDAVRVLVQAMLGKTFEHDKTPAWLLDRIVGGDKVCPVVDEANQKGWTALQRAASSGLLEIVKCLVLEGGANVRVGNDFHTTPLLHAATNGHLSTVRFLLGAGSAAPTSAEATTSDAAALTPATADPTPNSANSTPATAIAAATAAAAEAAEARRWWRRSGKRANDGGNGLSAWSTVSSVLERDIFGYSCTELAAQTGQLATVRWLLSPEGGGMSAATRDMQGNTLLLNAALWGHVTLVQWLLQPLSEGGGGSSVDERNNKGYTAISCAACQGHLPLVMWLATPTHEGGAGASLTDTEENGLTPLMLAASRGHLPVVRWLTSQHHPTVPTMPTCQEVLDVEQRDNTGATALILAARQGHQTVVQYLATPKSAGGLGADVHARDDQHQTPLLAALATVKMPIVQFLLSPQIGASPNDTSLDGTNCWDLAAQIWAAEYY